MDGGGGGGEGKCVHGWLRSVTLMSTVTNYRG